jgi:hypothetical protein
MEEAKFFTGRDKKWNLFSALFMSAHFRWRVDYGHQNDEASSKR